MARSGGRRSAPPIVYVHSAVDGMRLHRARKDALRASGSRMTEPAFVATTHCFSTSRPRPQERRGPPATNKIVLWGEELSVTELPRALRIPGPSRARRHADVAVLLGSFANEIFRNPGDTLPAATSAGLTSRPRRTAPPTVRCYRENLRARTASAHSVTDSFRLWTSWAASRKRTERVLVTQTTPGRAAEYQQRLLFSTAFSAPERRSRSGEDP